ncbi:hypothetical protein [Ferrimonas gelatinilytica]|uniref:Uncharacterized protein n=1 Tax=Ferrimonas gelatinilytica TaxID=1255257 RepID=A0ABP9RX34_9GAMM
MNPPRNAPMRLLFLALALATLPAWGSLSPAGAEAQPETALLRALEGRWQGTLLGPNSSHTDKRSSVILMAFPSTGHSSGNALMPNLPSLTLHYRFSLQLSNAQRPQPRIIDDTLTLVIPNASRPFSAALPCTGSDAVSAELVRWQRLSSQIWTAAFDQLCRLRDRPVRLRRVFTRQGSTLQEHARLDYLDDREPYWRTLYRVHYRLDAAEAASPTLFPSPSSPDPLLFKKTAHP